MLKWLGKLVDSNEKELNRLRPIVETINSLEPEFQELNDEELKSKTREFKERLQNGETLDEILPDAFAAVRESSKRHIGQRHFDVQLIGGAVLHQGKISEMKTGEGKTLVATLPLYLNALEENGCHLVTVNDYLSKRDPNWMGPIFQALGVSVATIGHETSFIFDSTHESGDSRWPNLHPVTRKQAYEADITYGTNHEFGFDYLRDNMVLNLSQCVQRPLNYAIVDEVDNILIDEARTPLIISGPAKEATLEYKRFARLVQHLSKEKDYEIDEKTKSVSLTELGNEKMEKLLRKEGLLKSSNLYDASNHYLTHHLENALKAHVIFKRDGDYVVQVVKGEEYKGQQVIIVDEFTGRLMLGRRYSEGLHQAIEAKEGVEIQKESLTLATVTLQNYFRLYNKLAGMTGTAATEAEEFHKIYKLEVVAIPTNKPMIRKDLQDLIYKTEAAKFEAVASEIESLYKDKRPVLIGTVSIEKNELLSEKLKRKGVPHQVLNAKNHEKEATIIKDAGQLGAVTVATNMAGRGVDIVLGPGVVEKGGLQVIGTERHEARRIDNQLRGRSGRQGDSGSSRFYVSLEDDIIKRFGGERIKSFMEWAGMEENTPIEHSLINKAIENAQIKTEAYHFEIRKHLVEYDDVVNKHREVIYGERKSILSGADLKANVLDSVHEEISNVVSYFLGRKESEEKDYKVLLDELALIIPLPLDITPESIKDKNSKDIEDQFLEIADRIYEQREQKFGAENMRILERLIMLRTIDNLWIQHLTDMENMRQGIGLRAIGQSDPLIAYKREGHASFDSLKAAIRADIARTIYRVDIVSQKEAPKPELASVPGKKPVGRNDPCPCGSGKKYKKCHGQ